MPGVPLITSGDPEAAAREEGEVTGAPGDGSRVAEETTAPTTEEERADRATGPSVEVERSEAAEEIVPPAPASPGVAPVVEVHSAPVPDEAVAAAVVTEENVGADASDAAHVAELEAALLAASSPGARTPLGLQPTRPPRQPRPRLSPKKLRSEAHRLDLVKKQSASFWSLDFVKTLM
jgi:hypothetical protein